MDKERISYLYQRYLENACTPEERGELRSVLGDPQLDELLKEVLSDSYYSLQAEELNEMRGNRGDEIFEFIVSQPQPSSKKGRLWLRIAAAAAVILCLGTGTYFYFHRQAAREQHAQNLRLKNDLLPGGNKAYLTLSNGSRISLTGAPNGKITQQGGVTVTKKADGQLVYQAPEEAPPIAITEVKYNTIETPRGGQYQVVLPDGSQVWLNASSSLKYPARFAGNERKVTLTGEAYFEVVHDNKQPFRVVTNGQVVEDAGTHFNINSYTDEPSTLTTLLEGAVKINNNMLLKPGEQASLLPTGNIVVAKVNTEEATAWKNGYFMFESEGIQPIMRKISRWYDVEVVYSGVVPADKFWGTVNRFSNVSQVLKKLELTNKVHFKLEGRRIMVTK